MFTREDFMGDFIKKIGFVSLGCDKNRVDTEKIISLLSAYKEFSFTGVKQEANIIIINTCAFIKMARDEAYDVINEMSILKKKGCLEKLVVIGCLPMVDNNIQVVSKAVDLVVLPKDYEQIDKLIFALFNKKPTKRQEISVRRLTTPLHYAYLKIADGCNNRCAFCKIPFIRGNYNSFLIKDLVDEASRLVDFGVREVILVAQDVTRFGKDNNQSLIDLLRALSKIKKLAWIRLLYCYPDMVSDDLIEEIASNPKVLHYIDIPLQHISNHVLAGMKRRSTKRDIVELINKLRKKIPDIKIRSTFMVGFPNETKKDFKELCNFLKVFKLDNVGFFKYSREEGTASFDYENQIDESVKDERLEKIEKIQQNIIEKKNKKLIGSTFKVICDKKEGKYYVGRSYFSAPDIDYQILFSSNLPLRSGNFVDVNIVDFKDGYFVGKVEKHTTY